MVNSSWTLAHISRLWWRLRPPQLVYPPCNVSSLATLPLDRKLKSLYLVSLAQFRPEKNHAMQLRAFALAWKQAITSWTSASEPVLAARLKLIGSCRDQDDSDRVTQLVLHHTSLTSHESRSALLVETVCCQCCQALTCSAFRVSGH